MATHSKRGPSIVTISLLLLFLLLLLGLGWVLATATVSGTATLPNGVIVDIATGCRGFSVAETSQNTEIEIAGRTFEFSVSTIVVDGVEVGAIDDSVKRMALTANQEGVTLISDGKVIVLPN